MRPCSGTWRWILPVFVALHQAPALGQAQVAATPTVHLSSDQMLAIAARALDEGDAGTAETLLHALLGNPEVRVRNEARFRLATIAAKHKNYVEAAKRLRAILDDEPGAQRARLELARILATMGDTSGARRELRQAQAGPLPPDVMRVVDQFSAALRERKAMGGHVELAIAPDSNINRASRSDTVSTVIGDFILGDSAKAHSGVGLAVRGTAYHRAALSGDATLLSVLSLDGSFYPPSRFDDFTGHVGVGPEFRFHKGRLQTQASVARRWIGTHPYSDIFAGEVILEHAVSPTAQVRGTAYAAVTDVIPNPSQHSVALQVAGSLEKAFSPRFGGSLTVSIRREAARHPAYSTWSGQLGAFGWYELGRTTLVGGVSYAPLKADEPLSIFPSARTDRGLQLIAGVTLRHFTFNGFAPQLRVTWEGNNSNIEIYRYSRVRTEIGVVRAF